MSNENNVYEDDLALLELTDEDGNEIQLELLDSIDYQGIEYLVSLPYGEGEEDEVIILEVALQSDGSELYLSVDDEDILAAVFGIFQERFQDIFTFED